MDARAKAVLETEPRTASAAVTNSRDGMTYGVVVALLASMALLLYVIIAQSHATFGRGIDLAEKAFAQHGEPPHVLIQQIYTLGMAHQVVTFKAAALFVGALIAILGGLFVLRTADAAYDARVEAGAWKLSLGTSSPGLVMVSLGCLLVGAAMVSKAHAPAASAVVPTPAPHSGGSSHTPYDDILRTLDQDASEGVPPKNEPEEKD